MFFNILKIYFFIFSCLIHWIFIERTLKFNRSPFIEEEEDFGGKIQNIKSKASNRNSESQLIDFYVKYEFKNDCFELHFGFAGNWDEFCNCEWNQDWSTNSKMARLKSTSNLNVSVSQMDKENNSNNYHLLLGGELLSPSRPPLPPLLRYLRNRSGSPPLPLSPLDNIAWSPNNNSPTHYAMTPIKVDEDGTLVMDGILLPSTGTSGRFSRSSTSATDSSPSSSSSSSSSGGRSLNKTDICRSWEDSGTCRYGFKCQVTSLHFIFSLNVYIQMVRTKLIWPFGVHIT